MSAYITLKTGRRPMATRRTASQRLTNAVALAASTLLFGVLFALAILGG